jgi:TatD DNase family protein
MLIDSHCHLDYLKAAGNLETALVAAKEAGVGYFLSPGVTLAGFSKNLAIAKQHNNIAVAVGLHPSESIDHELTVTEIVNLADNHLVIGIGETGLDYFYQDINKETQIKHLRIHINAAKEINKPLIIHTRDAAEDMLKILKEEQADRVGGVMHCFTENWETAQQAMELNFYIAFSGIITFPKALQIKEVAKKMPIERILIETDAPYLAPIPYRGKPNQPAYVKYVAECIAELKQMSLADIAKITTENFLRLFRTPSLR